MICAQHSHPRSPILVTGAHRSGTTWVGQMLNRSGQLCYIFEPLHPYDPARPSAWLPQQSHPVYPYIGPENAAEFTPLLDHLMHLRYPVWAQVRQARNWRQMGNVWRRWAACTIARIRRQPPLLKDPFALFAAEWLADHYRTNIVVMIRHPAAFASSLRRLGWRFDFRHWRDQPLLIDHYLQPFAAAIDAHCRGEHDIIDQAILLWNAIHHTIHLYQAAHPDWQFIRYEDLAYNPKPGFQKLYAALGLAWSPRSERAIQASAAESNRTEVDAGDWRFRSRNSRGAALTWVQRLTPAEIRRVRDGVGEVASWFYTDQNWDEAPTLFESS